MHLRVLVAFARLCCPLLAQIGGATRESFGVVVVVGVGEVRAVGPDHAARFPSDGVHYLALSRPILPTIGPSNCLKFTIGE